MSSFNKYYLNLASNYDDFQQNIPDDEIPKQQKQNYELSNPIDIKYGYQDNNSLLFQVRKNFPKSPDFKIGVDLIYLIDLSQTLNDETLEKIKSALKCLVKCLSDRDRLCIITYSNKADKLFPLIPLNEKNRQNIIEKIDQMIIKKGNSNILSALLITSLCLKLRQFQNQVTNVNIISQDYDLRKNSFDFKQIFQTETAFKLNAFLLVSKYYFQFSQIKKKESLKFGRYHIIQKIDQLSSILCFETSKLQQTVLMNLLISVKTHKNNPIQISECEGGKFIYVNPYEIQITKKLVSIGYNKTHLVCIGNGPKFEAGQICNIEVSYQQLYTNHQQNYIIPIYAQTQPDNIIDEAVLVQKYKLKSRSQMCEAIQYYDPYRIQDCIEVLKIFQSEVANLPDCIKQQLSLEAQQFELAISKYTQNSSQQIENPFIQIDEHKKRLKFQAFENL